MFPSHFHTSPPLHSSPKSTIHTYIHENKPKISRPSRIFGDRIFSDITNVIPDYILVANVSYRLKEAEEDRIEKAAGTGLLATSLTPEKILISHC